MRSGWAMAWEGGIHVNDGTQLAAGKKRRHARWPLLLSPVLQRQVEVVHPQAKAIMEARVPRESSRPTTTLRPNNQSAAATWARSAAASLNPFRTKTSVPEQPVLEKPQQSSREKGTTPEPEIQYLQELVAVGDSYTPCRSSTERLWLATSICLRELAASGSETRSFADVASRYRLWGLSVVDISEEGALPPQVKGLVQGILADIAVTLTYLLEQHEKIMNRGDCKRNQLVTLLGQEEFAATALDEPDYLEVGCSEGMSFSDFAAKCHSDIEGLVESLFELLPSMYQSRLIVNDSKSG